MKLTGKIDIECGMDTCAYAKDKFCRYMGTIKFGSIAICTFFPSDIATYTILDEDKGWTQRCPDCKKTFRMERKNDTRYYK